MAWDVKMVGESDGRKLYSEGEHSAEITAVELVTKEKSKSGNPYFLWKLKIREGTVETRTTLIEGKRWLLKQMLSACGIVAKEGDPEERYSFSAEDVIGKKVIITIVNRESSFMGNDGEMKKSTKSEVNRIQAETPF